MSIDVARKILEDWLQQRGFRVVDKLSDRELVLMEGNNTVYLRISTEEFPTESYIIDELSNVMRNRFNYNKAYIAFPQSARGLINGKLFRSNRVGVYLYDLSSTDPERAVEELIPSIPIQLQQGVDEGIKRRIDDLEKAINDVRNTLLSINVQSLAKDIDELRSRVTRIEQVINDLTERVNRIESIESQIMKGSMTVQGSTPTSGGAESEGGLPDFLSDNPWIEVLRRRGGGNG